MRKLLLFLATGCNFDASSKVDANDTAAGSALEDAETDDTEEGTDEPEVDPLTVDNDDDGYTENQGDCDDTNAEVFPGAEDVCDGISNDCDDDIDEDALDDFEPNDTVHWSLGVVESDPISLEAFLHSESDIDRFDYTVEDGLVDLVVGIQVRLTGLSSDITYRMTIIESESGTKVFDEFNEAGDEELVYEHNDTVFGNESGVYQIRIKTLAGFGCETPYTLTIVEDNFLP